jgi:hypothetical protein
MPESTPIAPPVHPPRPKLELYEADIRLTGIALGVDNIHYDVFLSPKFVEFSRKYIRDLVRQSLNLQSLWGTGIGPDTERERRRKQSSGMPEHGPFRRMLTDVLQASLTNAKFRQSIDTDLLHRLALLKFFTQEIGDQFSSVLVECKEWIRGRGELFEHSEQAHVMRSKISEMRADRKRVHRQVGETLCRIWNEVEEGVIAKARRALFGESFRDTYEILSNNFLFVENGNDDHLFLEHYVLLGNFMNDPDRFDVFDTLLLDFVAEYVHDSAESEELSKAKKSSERLLEQARLLRSEIARIEEERTELSGRGGAEEGFPRLFKRRAVPQDTRPELEDLRRKSLSLEDNLEELGPQIEAARQRVEFLSDEYRSRLGDYLNQPSNARLIFESDEFHGDGRNHILEEWMHRLEERDLLFHVLASYELRKIASEYCPPIHLQQLKKALVNRDEMKRVEHVIEQFPARKISIKKLDESSRAIRRRSHEETLPICLQFAEDLMRLRRGRRNYQQVAAWMERIQLVRSEQARELSRANKSLYEILLPEEGKPADDPIVNHAVIKADVRGSTSMTKDLLSRGMNPASHFSMNLHEPVKRMLERYGAAKVFIEGDAIILAIYETESTRATQRAVARACVLAREILAVTQAYNGRAKGAGLPPLELGVGVAFQDSAPSLWTDGDSHIMISRALNLSDRLSGCAKMAKRLFKENAAPFNVYLLQSLMEDAEADEGEELLVRYNMNGIELNEEGFQKLSSEISLAAMGGNFPMPWGKERVQLYFGEVPLGESLEPIVVRKGLVRQLLPGRKIGAQGTRAYYEVCTDAKLLDLARKKFADASRQQTANSHSTEVTSD